MEVDPGQPHSVTDLRGRFEPVQATVGLEKFEWREIEWKLWSGEEYRTLLTGQLRRFFKIKGIWSFLMENCRGNREWEREQEGP